MKRLIALSIEGTWSGEWQLASGNEKAVIAGPIGKGEKVWLEVEVCEGPLRTLRKLLLSATPTPLRGVISRYRVVKESSREVERLRTTVELLLGARAA